MNASGMTADTRAYTCEHRRRHPYTYTSTFTHIHNYKNMKTDFSINVQVSLGAAPELVALVNAVLSHMPAAVQDGGALPVSSGRVENGADGKAEAEPASQERTETGAKSGAKQGPTEAAKDTQVQAEPAPKAETPKAEAPKALTAEDVREAMHRTRQRIEGEDYKENTASEAYMKYHKALTAQFKNIAALLGADKPSALPADKIGSFIEECDRLGVMADGTIGTEPPF